MLKGTAEYFFLQGTGKALKPVAYQKWHPLIPLPSSIKRPFKGVALKNEVMV